MTTSDSTVERGSGNVFADLGHPDADAHLLKAELVSRIDAIVRQRDIHSDRGRAPARPVPARRVAASQWRLPRILPGAPVPPAHRASGRDIDIVIRQPRSATGGKLRIAAAEPV